MTSKYFNRKTAFLCVQLFDKWTYPPNRSKETPVGWRSFRCCKTLENIELLPFNPSVWWCLKTNWNRNLLQLSVVPFILSVVLSITLHPSLNQTIGNGLLLNDTTYWMTSITVVRYGSNRYIAGKVRCLRKYFLLRVN